MVRITSENTRKRNIFPGSYRLNTTKGLSIHYFVVFTLILVGLVLSLYYLLLSQEDITTTSGTVHRERLAIIDQRKSGLLLNGMVASAHSTAPRILAARQPFLLYGTAWKKERTAELVSQAVHHGFRFIDTACQPKHYQEDLVGKGWKKAATELGLDRSDMFLQTKYTSIGGQDPNNVPYNPRDNLPDQVATSLQVSLRNLQTEYLDSWVLHSPLREFDETMTVWRAMESFVDQGIVRRLGISNCYDYDMFMQLYEQARIKPSVLQNRFYADSSFDTELRQFCKEHDIWYQSFWTLTANRHALATPQAQQLASSKGLTPQTLLYAFLMELGYATPLDGSTSESHMEEDIALMERLHQGSKVFENEQQQREFAQLLGMPDL